MSLKHVLGFMGRANRTRTPKIWAIAHEKSHKTRKRRVLLRTLKRVSGVYMPCKLPWNPKTVGNTSRKQP